jgi:predicted porin
VVLRKILGLLVLGLSASRVYAASDLVLYGVVDTGLSYVLVSKDAIAGQKGVGTSDLDLDTGVQSGSRWGLTGTHAIAHGWSLSFVLEGGLSSITGKTGQGDRPFGRQSTLGLSNEHFGQLLVGRQSTISTNYFSTIDPFGESFGQANMGASFGTVNTVRYDNLLQYQSNPWHGLTFGVGYSFNTGASARYGSPQDSPLVPQTHYFGTSANMRALTAGAQFTQDAFNVVVAYDRVFPAGLVPDGSDGVSSNPSGVSPSAWIVGATYDFNVVEIAAAFGRTSDGAASGNGPGNGWMVSDLPMVTGGAAVLFDEGFDSQSAMIGFTVPMGGIGNELMVSWQMQQPLGRIAAEPLFATQNIVGAAYTYGLSSQVNLYFWGSYGNNFQMSNTAKSSVVGAGLRYLF